MKKSIKKLLCLALTFVMMFGVFAMNSSAAVGDTVYLKLTADGWRQRISQNYYSYASTGSFLVSGDKVNLFLSGNDASIVVSYNGGIKKAMYGDNASVIVDFSNLASGMYLVEYSYCEMGTRLVNGYYVSYVVGEYEESFYIINNYNGNGSSNTGSGSSGCDHDWEDADCENPKKCWNCGATEGEPLGHSFINYEYNYDATCTQDGTETAYCDNCWDVEDTRVAQGTATGHDWKEADYTNPKTCINCGATEGEPLEKANNPEDCLEYVLDGMEAYIESCDSGIEGELKIPSELGGHKVTQIGMNAFENCDKLTSVIIPEGVEFIGAEAFAYCDSLKEITIPSTVTTIGNSAFLECSSVKKVYAASIDSWLNIKFGDEYSNPSNLTWVSAFDVVGGADLYIGGKLLTELDLQNKKNVNIPNYAFSTCKSIKSVKLPAKTNIGSWAFANCENLASVTIGDTSVCGEYAFSGCENLKSITVGKGGNVNNAFIDTGYSNDKNNWENGVLYIGSYLIQADEKISGSYVVKDGTTAIANNAFKACENLTSVTIPEGVVSIGDMAFRYCNGIKELYLPKSLESTGDYAFEFCTSLKDVYYSGTAEDRKKITISDSGWEEFLGANWHYAECKHEWQKATCTMPKYCKICGEMEGEMSEHKWNKATCTDPKTCKVCGTTSGKKLGHEYKKATCTDPKTCKVCKKTSGKALGHDYETKYTKATTSKNGVSYKQCKRCDNTNIGSTINKIKSVKLSTTEYTYNGKAKSPKVTVKDSKGNVIKDKYYTVTGTGEKKVGEYTVKVKFKTKYSGTVKVKYVINPKKSSVSSVTAAKKSLKVKIKKVSSQATGYEIQYSTSKKFTKSTTKTKKITSYKTTSATIKSLKAKKTYYVRVRTYKTVDGKKYYSDWSSAKSKKTK